MRYLYKHRRLSILRNAVLHAGFPRIKSPQRLPVIIYRESCKNYPFFVLEQQEGRRVPYAPERRNVIEGKLLLSTTSRAHTFIGTVIGQRLFPDS